MPTSDTPDVPLDLTVSRTIKQKQCEKEPGRKLVLQSVDLSDRQLVTVVHGVLL